MSDACSLKRVGTILVGLLIATACRKPEGPSKAADIDATESMQLEQPVLSQPARVEIDAAVSDPDRWLYAEAAMDPARGGWVSGTFDAERNKLSIRTKDVRRFAVDAGRVPIDWNKLVILSIDGRNSELRRRDFVVYHFDRTDHGEWVVKEP